MVRLRIPPTTLAALTATVLCVIAPLTFAQSPIHEKPVPEPIEPKPFSTDPSPHPLNASVEFRPADQLSQPDQLLLANAESSIAEHAGFAGLEYQQSNWHYHQVICPTLPNHLFLQYTRSNGQGDVSMFSASIPRNGEGRVRIIPILKRSYSLFSPAPINALTISAFNHIRTEEGDSVNSDWLGNAVCYAALAGSRPQLVPPDAIATVDHPIPALRVEMVATLAQNGTEVLKFSDTAAQPYPTAWTMTFTRSGKLIKATHQRASLVAPKPVPQKTGVARTWQVPPRGQD